MTLYLGSEDIRALASTDVLMAAAKAAVEAERDGVVVMPPRLDIDLPTGFLRVMPAAMGTVMGVKVMTLVKGLGNRYLILLYNQPTGDLVAVLDADEVTRLRTAATTALAGSLLAADGAAALALLGSGFEAESHLRLLARLWPLEEVWVYSPTTPRLEAFAERMCAELRIAVRTAASSEDAVARAPVSVLATKATEPVVDGTAFPRGAVVLSIGSTRPDLRELDTAMLQRTATLLVDDATQVRLESGDIIEGLATGALPEDRIVGMSALDGNAGRLSRDDSRDLMAFKSVGTALQDLALASSALDAAVTMGRGRELGELARLKAFAAKVGDLSPVGEPPVAAEADGS